jgi:hypothetical protein
MGNARMIGKADALVRAYVARYGRRPTTHAVVCILSVAELETGCGDFKGSHNWGQIQRRQLTADERALVDRGELPPPRDDREILSWDTSPKRRADGSTEQHPYPVWLRRWPDDQAGAADLLSVLLDARPSIGSRIDTITIPELAAAMYATRYYEGSHARSEPNAAALNAAAYGNGLTHRLRSLVEPGLTGWHPDQTVIEPTAPGTPSTVLRAAPPRPPAPAPPPVRADAPIAPDEATPASTTPAPSVTQKRVYVAPSVRTVPPASTRRAAILASLALMLAGVSSWLGSRCDACRSHGPDDAAIDGATHE